jgi:HK97 family phage portal protein
MLTGALIRVLDKAESPRAVRAAVWALEKTTGYSTKEVLSAVNEAGWYERNGYRGIASQLGGQISYSGKAVTMDVALESSAFYSGTKIISEDMGTLPFFMYRRSKDRANTDKFYDHPLWRTLHGLVNPEISSSEFVEALTAHAILTGNSYALIQHIQSGVWLWPWQPGEVKIDRVKATGMLVYEHQEPGGNWKTYTRDQVFHLRGFTLDGVAGDNLLRRARHTIGLTSAADEYAARYFANDATPGVVVFQDSAVPGAKPVGPESVQAMKDAWKKWHQGVKNSHEPAVLQGGFKPMLLTPNAQQAQLLEARKFQVLEACRVLRLPPWKLAELDRAIQANAEQQAIEYVQFSLSPWQRRWRDAVHRCLLTVDEQIEDRVYAEQSIEALQRGDFAGQSEGFRKLLEKGVFTINEVRRMLNLNPIDGGDTAFVQLNLGPIQEIAAGASLPNSLVPVGTAKGV